MRIENRTVELFPSAAPGAPLVLLNGEAGEGEAVAKAVRDLTSADFTLAAVSGLDWGDDLTPWPAPPAARGMSPCAGLADAYLQQLAGRILPAIAAALPARPAYAALAGYSLAGLFAAWAVTQCSLFERVASVSGSLWYPDFVKYVAGNGPKSCVRRAYFSLGDAEPHTRNRAMRSVLEDTQQVEERFERSGVDTRFELNPGNHFTDEDLRTTRGIRWLLEDGGASDVPVA